jgi:PAS domain S-box-containing protein
MTSTLRRWAKASLVARDEVAWKDRAAALLTVGAAVAALAAIVGALRDDDAVLGALAALAFCLVLASQVLLRREMYERLATSRKHWFASSPRGLAEMDVNLRIVEGNARLASLLTIEESDLEGSLLTRYFPLEEAAGIVAQFETLASGAVNTIESDSLGMRPDKTRIWLHWRATTVRRANGTLDYYVITFEDTTQKHAAEKAAQSNLAELEKLDHLKSEFTSLVSHEFRTALTGIQGMSELINGGLMKVDEVHEYSGYIFKEAERINRLITDMLDLDRLEAGKMKMRMLPVDLNATIRDVIDRTKAVCTTHTFVMDLDPVQPRVLGDSDRLVQVLTNLLSNAIKYSPEGGEILTCTRLAGNLAQISVRDHGIGVPAEFVDQLFGRFERYEANPTKIIGTGLGLAISRQIVEMHGGRIWVERGETDGSVFHLTMPSYSAPVSAPKRITAAAAA